MDSPKKQSMDESPLTSSPTSNRSISPFFFPEDDDDIFSPHCDELPVFELERSLSPIGQRLFASPYQVTERHRINLISDDESEHPDFVSLDEIHSLIGPSAPEDDEMQLQVHKLETIFEGIFLETPPRGQHKGAGAIVRKPKVHRMIYDENVENVPPPPMDVQNCNDQQD
jgi:hypothetical protein